MGIMKALRTFCRASPASIFILLSLFGCSGSKANEHKKALKSEDPEVRASAAIRLAEMGEEADPYIPEIIPLLKDADPKVKMAAANSLATFGHKAKDAAADMASLVDDSDEDVQKVGLVGLAAIGAGEELGSAAKRLLKSKSVSLRMVTAMTLSEIGPSASAAVPALAKTLYDPDPNVRLYSAIALGNMGKKAAPALPALNAAAGDSVPFVRTAAKEALSKVQ